MLTTPVAFLIFNRPEATRRTFARIREARPPVLLVVADGPRPDHADDEELCRAARDAVAEVDWNCRVLTNFSAGNLGCRRRVSSGLQWVFNEVDEAIILEDDCLPHESFFGFCQELLQRYRDDERVGQIGGVTFRNPARPAHYSYYFSRYFHVWGWASWRRAWEGYDESMGRYAEARRSRFLRRLLGDWRLASYWEHVLDKVYRGEVDTWDYQWMFHNWLHGRLAIAPSAKLVANIGFGSQATHTKSGHRAPDGEDSGVALPLSHPPQVVRDAVSDRDTERRHYRINFQAYGMVPLSKLKRLLRAL